MEINISAKSFHWDCFFRSKHFRWKLFTVSSLDFPDYIGHCLWSLFKCLYSLLKEMKTRLSWLIWKPQLIKPKLSTFVVTNIGKISEKIWVLFVIRVNRPFNLSPQCPRGGCYNPQYLARFHLHKSCQTLLWERKLISHQIQDTQLHYHTIRSTCFVFHTVIYPRRASSIALHVKQCMWERKKQNKVCLAL